MFRVKLQPVRKIRTTLRSELTLRPFFKAAAPGMERVQRQYFFKRGVDRGRTLSARTVRARSRRWGYYRIARTAEVSSTRPYGVWSGNTFRHTFGPPDGKAVQKITTRRFRLSHRLVRRIDRYWDEKSVRVYFDTAAETYFRQVLRGRRPVRVYGRVA